MSDLVELVDVSITVGGQKITGLMEPVFVAAPKPGAHRVVADRSGTFTLQSTSDSRDLLNALNHQRVRRYTHWTEVALAFGDEAERAWARKWLKRKARMRRKARRGYA